MDIGDIVIYKDENECKIEGKLIAVNQTPSGIVTGYIDTDNKMLRVPLNELHNKFSKRSTVK